MYREPDCGLLIKQIHTTLEKNANNSLRDAGLTLAQVSLLLTLLDHPDRLMPLKELEKALHLAQSTTAGIVSRLGQKGLTDCFRDAGDRRVKLVRLTPAGEDCCRQAEEHRAEAERALLSGLTETERTIFCGLLQKVCGALN